MPAKMTNALRAYLLEELVVTSGMQEKQGVCLLDELCAHFIAWFSDLFF
jgi:hypothetical protein